LKGFDFEARLKNVRKKMEESKVDCVFFASDSRPSPNIVYLTGIRDICPFFLLVTKKSSYAWVFDHQSELFDSSWIDNIYSLDSFQENLKKTINQEKIEKLGFDDSWSRPYFLFKLQKYGKVIPFSEHMYSLREKKDDLELKMLAKASKITLSAIDSAEIVPGKTENQIAGEMEVAARFLGASLDAFEPLVISGKRSSLLHGLPSNQVISKTSSVLVDVGARVEGYCGDFSRSFCFKDSTRQVKDAILAVEEAKNKAVKAAKVGVTAGELSDLAHQIICDYGFGQYSFESRHALGHQVGLEEHDGPLFVYKKIEKGMAFTIEPGIYVSNKFGIRFEDVVLKL